MSQALTAAVASAAKLPEEEQNVLAAILLQEMANGAIQDFQAGRVQPIAYPGTPQNEAKDRACNGGIKGRHIDLVLGRFTQDL